MAHAIRNVELDPLLINAAHHSITKSTIYVYLKAKIPLIFGFTLVDCTDPTNVLPIGKHAVTITGYSLGQVLQEFDKDEFYLTSSKIDKIYVHDDQIGPFARMEFENTTNSIATSWLNEKKKSEKLRG